MCTLSASLSFLDPFYDIATGEDGAMSLKDVMSASSRRGLIYPYLRMWKLVKQVLVDVTKILLLGEKCVLKCLLQMRAVLEHTDTHYMLNKVLLVFYILNYFSE